MGCSRKNQFLAIIVSLLLSDVSVNAECGYKSCNPVKEDHINIHLVPHSHDDLGYLKTVEQYYYGAHDDYQQAGVQYIIDSVVEALLKDNTRRFIYVETGFFWKWWLQQDEATKDIVTNLVNNGQLEFVGGGWSMNDEATADYQSIIDQMTWGLRKLNETFGKCGRPRVSWQIDPFGHSREMASIFAQLGFDGFFLNRIDYQDLAFRKAKRSMEFIWRGNPDNLGGSSDIYTNVLFRHYKVPDGLCFDVKCTDEPIVDDIMSLEYNVNKKSEDFIYNWIVPASQAYASNNILVPMGDDFHYQYAGKYYKNMDKLIKYINSDRRDFNGTKYNVIYSTPSCYLKAVYEAINGTLNSAVKTDDFFPYASTQHNYWTGYYTSRPTGKRYGRYANNFLQVCKQLNALTNVTSLEDVRLNVLRESLGVFQHHDGVTGTEREHVARDYNRMLHEGIVGCEGITNQTLFHLIKSLNMTFTTCPMLNISECERTENEKQLIVTVYNPLSRPVDKFVRLPIPDDSSEIIITDPAGNLLVTQTVQIHPSFFKLPGRNSIAQYDVIFKAENVPPLGFKSFYFERRDGNESIEYPKVNRNNVSYKVFRTTANISVDYFSYNGNNGNYSSDEFSPSQPYVFRPDPENPIRKLNITASFMSYVGPLLEQVMTTYDDYVSQIVRKYNNDSVVEISYLVGPLPYDKQGLEVIGRYQIDSFDHDETFYTDTNSRGSIKRIRDYRPTWNVSVAEPEAGNYYPVTSHISINNRANDLDMTLFTDRSQGGTSPGNSQLELMIHRNTMSGGPGALAEPLNEQAFGTGVVTSGSHYVLVRDKDTYSNLLKEEVSQKINLDSWIFFASPNGVPFKHYSEGHVMEFSGLTTSLPRQVHILTLEPWGPSTLLLRLENFIGKDNQLSNTVTVNLQDLFSTFVITYMTETTLGANQLLSENRRIQFNKISAKTENKQEKLDDFVISLDPMEIRTFIITIAYK